MVLLMKKRSIKKYIFSGLCCLLMLSLAACQSGKVPEENDEVLSITVESWQEVTELDALGAPGSKAVLNRIQLSGSFYEENDLLHDINEDMERQVQDYLQQKADNDAMLYEADNSLTFEHELNYELAYYDGYASHYSTLASIVVRGYDRCSDAAHSAEYSMAYVYDVSTGKQVLLADILGEDYRQLLGEAIVEQIRAAGEEDNYYPGYDELIRNHLNGNNWYVDGKYIKVLFDPYEIAPGTLGVLEFSYQYWQ